MYEKINLEKAMDVIVREMKLNREEAELHSMHNPIWSARMAAVHVGQMLFRILLEAKERGGI